MGEAQAPGGGGEEEQEEDREGQQEQRPGLGGTQLLETGQRRPPRPAVRNSAPEGGRTSLGGFSSEAVAGKCRGKGGRAGTAQERGRADGLSVDGASEERRVLGGLPVLPPAEERRPEVSGLARHVPPYTGRPRLILKSY